MSYDFLNGKTVLVTGGTGSFGRHFVRQLLKESLVRKLIVFSRDELKQSEMREEFDDERLSFFLGDIRDLERLHRAFRGVDIVVHAAALKHVPVLEYNPIEAIKTNVIGSQNVIDAAINQGVGKVVFISTDKAAEPANLYGATKLCAEKLFVNANNFSQGRSILSAVRYGNVLGSRGSIVDVLKKNKNAQKVKITHPDMTRFWITLQESFWLVMLALKNMEGGEIFIPKIPTMKVTDLFDVVAPGIPKEIIGIRPGEKLHEVLVTEDESRHAVEFDKFYVILSEFPYFSQNPYRKYYEIGKKIESEFRFSSNTNDKWLTKEDLKSILEIS